MNDHCCWTMADYSFSPTPSFPSLPTAFPSEIPFKRAEDKFSFPVPSFSVPSIVSRPYMLALFVKADSATVFPNRFPKRDPIQACGGQVVLPSAFFPGSVDRE